MKKPPSGSATEDDEDRHHNPTPTPVPVPSPSPASDQHHGEKKKKKNDYMIDTRGLGPPQIGSGEARGRRRSNDSAARVSTSSAHGLGRTQNAPPAPPQPTEAEKPGLSARQPLAKDIVGDDTLEGLNRRRWKLRNPWSWSTLTLATTAIAALLLYAILDSFMHRQRDQAGCIVPGMYPSYVRFSDFDTEHTRFASKYSLYLYREQFLDDDPRVKGVPVLFIPGNAGSHKQVRSLGSEAARYFNDVLRHDLKALTDGKRALDVFAADFNEDITAFHGQTLLDQAEYLNDAVAYILSLYHNPKRSNRDPDLPDPNSVILIGHSMGGIVARTMLTMPNYQPDSVNTIITLSAPHARPPVSFDADIVRTYQNINSYWRHAYSQKWASDNPLWHVTLISIAGGGLDTVVPSDYASTSSLVPDTHGFTVFTSSIPNVWTGMDHLAITWCHQLRRSVVRALVDIIDVSRSAQTRPRAQRMRAFRKWFLTGMEDVAENMLPHKEPKTILTLEDHSNSIVAQGERLTLRGLGQHRNPKVHLMPIPPQGAPDRKRFTLLTDQQISGPNEIGNLEVHFCSVFPIQGGHPAASLSMKVDSTEDNTSSTRLACKSASSDVIHLPASRENSVYPSDDGPPFSYLQYDLEDLGEHQFVAILDKAAHPTFGFAIAEFSSIAGSVVRTSVGLGRLLASGTRVRLPGTRPLVTDIKIPALHSSLLAYRLQITRNGPSDASELFMPLLRQHISAVYESKFFVNVRAADISLHGVAPYMPPPFKGLGGEEGLSLQIWADPTYHGALDVALQVDVRGSMGKLWMRYRTVFAAFPLLVVALVFRKQFKIYDETGVFMSFSESMNQCLRTSLPVLYVALTFLAVSLAKSSHAAAKPSSGWLSSFRGNATESLVDYSKNGLLLGSQDTFFWFLVPFFGLLCSGVCIATNYVVLGLTHLLASTLGLARMWQPKNDDGRRASPAFAASSSRQRIITTSVLLFLVSTVIPYQFAYLVLCIVQLVTCTRALKVARENRSEANFNFYNYAHSVLVLMLWVLPINMPTLVVWVRNLAVHWLTPFSSHHNILSISPYILLVETISTGRMVPRVNTRIRYFTNLLLFAIAIYAAVYGVTYAYLLHQLVNVLCAWLVSLHFSTSSFSLARLNRLLDGAEADGLIKKRP